MTRQVIVESNGDQKVVEDFRIIDMRWSSENKAMSEDPEEETPKSRREHS